MLKLRNFSHASRQLGSSVGILSSAYQLRVRVAQLLRLFHQNAVHLFPRKVHQTDTSIEVNDQPLRTKRKRSKPPPNVRTPLITEDLDLEEFPEQMSRFAEDIMTFLECLIEFPEFTDEVVNASISSFHKDLKVGLGHSYFHIATPIKTTLTEPSDCVVSGLMPRPVFRYADF